MKSRPGAGRVFHIGNFERVQNAFNQSQQFVKIGFAGLLAPLRRRDVPCHQQAESPGFVHRFTGFVEDPPQFKEIDAAHLMMKIGQRVLQQPRQKTGAHQRLFLRQGIRERNRFAHRRAGPVRA